MPRDCMCDDQVEREIRRLLDSPYVKLAKKEEQIRNRRRKYMYDLRWLEKKGKELEASGVTMDTLNRYNEDPEFAFEEF